jgi:TPP-dependent pyruvate/acetoin dehydrogenase alpha subunit
VTAGEIEARARTLGIESTTVDGMDVWAVRAAAEAAVVRARDGAGPQFIQSLTYRFVGHSRSDPGAYRRPGELDEWKLRDPLIVARRRLQEELGVAEDDLDVVDAAIEDQLEQMVEAGLAAPYPDPLTPVAEFKA